MMMIRIAAKRTVSSIVIYFQLRSDQFRESTISKKNNYGIRFCVSTENFEYLIRKICDKKRQ